MVVAVVHVARPRAVRALRIAGDLHLQHVEARAERGQEQVVKDLAALRFAVVHEQAGGACVRQPAVPIVGEHGADPAQVDIDELWGLGGARHHGRQ